MHIPKILKPFLKPTSEETTPTDLELDNDIAYVSFLLHQIWPMLKKIMHNKNKRFIKYRWKVTLGRIVLITLILGLSYLAFVKVFDVQIVTNTVVAPKDQCLSYKADSSMNLSNFLLQMIYIESRYDKTARRDGSQYWGLYQIGTQERKNSGFGDVPMNVFMNHPEIQDLCMIHLMKYNRDAMRKYINKYNGKIVDGILVTESGIIALCHLGCGTAMSYLDSGVIPVADKNGNPVRLFLKLGGYDLRLDHIKHSIGDALIYNANPAIPSSPIINN